MTEIPRKKEEVENRILRLARLVTLVFLVLSAVPLLSPATFVRALTTTTSTSPVNSFSINTTVVSVGLGPWGAAFDPANGHMYVTNAVDNTVSVIHRKTVVATVSVGPFPTGVAFDPANNAMYVTNFHSNTVSVINSTTNALVTTITVGPNPLGVAYDPANHDMYVVSEGDNGLWRIDGASNGVIGEVSSQGGHPLWVAYDAASHDMWVTNNDVCCGSASPVAIFADSTFLTDVGVSSNPFGVIFDPANQEMYVVAQSTNQVSVFNATTNGFITNIAVGSSPLLAAFDPVNSEVYVTNSKSNSVSVISSSTNMVVATINVGSTVSFPIGVAFNPNVRDTYVALFGDDNVILIRKTNVVAH